MVARRLGDDELASRADEVARHTYDLSEFLTDVAGVEDVGAYYPHRVAYHPTCHSLRMIGVGDRPLRLLRHVAGIDLFLDGPQAKARDAVHVVFAGEKVRPEYLLPAPDVSEAERSASVRILTLGALVRMKLTSFRDKDRTHLRDLLEVGLVDSSWYPRLPPELAARLRELVETPHG